MAESRAAQVMCHLPRPSAGRSVNDAQLMAAFLTRRDEAAFSELVRRHGPMVLSACRRVLGCAADAEDAFQATFLVLVRHGPRLKPRVGLANWLYGVAY